MNDFPAYKTLVGCFLLLPSIFAIGCDTSPDIRYDKLDLVDVSGTVTLDGRPLPNAVVTFVGEKGRLQHGLTDADGYYTMQFDSNVSGVMPGKKTVKISTSKRVIGLNAGEEGEAPPGEGGGEVGMDGASPAQLELVPAKYNKQSELTVTVKPGEDQTFDFDLESEPTGA